jgi:thiol peroxidase
MATTSFKETPVNTVGELPEVGADAPDFTLVGTDLADVTSAELRGRRVVLNIFPSVDTGVCAASVRRFNEIAAGLDETTVVCASHDLPFALKRFCGAEGIENVVSASGFRSTFGDDFGMRMTDGPLEGLLARAVVVLDRDGSVLHTELVPAIGQEPDYDAAVGVLGAKSPETGAAG